MVDKLSPIQRSANMARIHSKDMKPEMIVRKLTYNLGYRYRLHRKDLPGKPDLVFSNRKKVIFVHGCFWHQHDDPNCPDGLRRKPKSNTSYWNPKLLKNVTRDASNQKHLEDAGWQVMVIWECEIKYASIAAKIKNFLDD